MFILILFTTAYAPLDLLQGWLQDSRRGQPDDPGHRGRAPGLRRRAQLGGDLAGPPRAGRPADAVRCPGAARDAPHRGCERRPPATAPSSPSGCCGADWLEGERDGVRLRLHAPEPAPLPVAVVLGLLLRGDRLAALRPERARAELESLLAAQREDGFIGHTIFWDRPVTLTRLPFYNVHSRRSFQTETIQPPLLAWAWRIAVGDPAERAADRRPGRLADGQPRSRGRRAALDRPARRVGPRRLAQVRPGLGLARQRAARLPAPRAAQPPPRLERAAASSTRGGPVLCEVLVNVLWSLSLQALGAPVGDAGAGRAALGRAPRPLPRQAPGRRRPAVATWAALSPLALPDLPEQIGRRLVEEHLLDPRRFWTPVAPPSVSADEPSYEPGGGRGLVRRYWRGPTWVNSAWLVWLGLRRLGYAERGRRLAAAPRRRRRARGAARVLRPARRRPDSAPSTSPGQR